MIGAWVQMAEHVNRWDPYNEIPFEDREPVFDDPIIYGTNVKSVTLTVYSPEGRVQKYWNARILKDLLGYVRIACPRDGKILKFNWMNWTAYFFTSHGMSELVMMPDFSRKTITQLCEEVK